MYTSGDVSELVCECCWVWKHSRATGRYLETQCSGDNKLSVSMAA